VVSEQESLELSIRHFKITVYENESVRQSIVPNVSTY